MIPSLRQYWNCYSQKINQRCHALIYTKLMPNMYCASRTPSAPDGHKMHRNAKMLKVSVTQSTIVAVPHCRHTTKGSSVGQDWEHLEIGWIFQVS